MSLTIPSDLATSANSAATITKTGEKISGVLLIAASLAELNGWIATEQANIALDPTGYTACRWKQGTLIRVNGEADGVFRRWDRTSGSPTGNALTAIIADGSVVTLASSLNSIIQTTGIPSDTTGINGDIAIDNAAGILYTKASGFWGGGVYIKSYTHQSETLATGFGDAVWGVIGDSTVKNNVLYFDAVSISQTGNIVTITRTDDSRSLLPVSCAITVTGSRYLPDSVKNANTTIISNTWNGSVNTITYTGSSSANITNFSINPFDLQVFMRSTNGIGSGFGRRGWAKIAEMILGASIYIPAQACQGVNGENLTGTLARLPSYLDSLPFKITGLMVASCINDCVGIANGSLTVAQVQNNILAISRICQARGILPLFIGPPPITNTYTGSNGSYNQAALSLIMWFSNYSVQNPKKILWCDVWTPMVDRTSINGLGISAMLDPSPSPGVHPNQLGAWVYAWAIYKALQAWRGIANRRGHYGQADVYNATYGIELNMLDNACSSLSGTLTSTALTTTPVNASNWAVSRVAGTGTINAAISPIATVDDNGLTVSGRELIISFSGTTVSDIVTISTYVAYGSHIANGIIPGKRYIAELDIEWRGSPTKQPLPGFLFYDSGNQYSGNFGNAMETDQPPAKPCVMRMRSNVLQVSPGAIYAMLKIDISIQGTGSFVIRNAAVRRLPDGYPILY